MNSGHSNGSPKSVREHSVCPLCSHTGVNTSMNCHDFTYGSGNSAVSLTVNVPVRQCESCEFEFLDEAAEQLKHEAVCQHLGVLPPSAIRRIRENHQMSRSRFAQVTGLGEASSNRWENGISIQSHGNDRYLRLLSRAGTMAQLLTFLATRSHSAVGSIPIENRFRALCVTNTVLTEQNSFRLRKAA